MIRSTRHLLAYEMGLRSAYRTAGVRGSSPILACQSNRTSVYSDILTY